MKYLVSGRRTYQDDVKRWFQDPEFKKHYDREGVKLKIAFRIAELRHKTGLTQTELAKKIGTTQSSVARLENAGTENYEISTLEKVAKAFGKHLRVTFQ